MAVDELDHLKEQVRSEQKSKPPKDVQDRLERGRKRAEELAPMRSLCFEFLRDNTYAWVDEKNILQQQATVTTVRGTGKPPWRARTRRNMILDVVAHEVSASTQRVPSYEVVPSTSDPDDQAAKVIAEKVALYGYDKWRIRDATVKAVTHAVVADEAFAWPYFDTSVGPYVRDEDGTFGEGEIRVRVYGANEVYWEPGTRFEDSPWHVVEHARPLSKLEQEYPDVKFTADADTGRIGTRSRDHAKDTKMVLVSEYLERPSIQRPEGRWLCVANGRQIADKGDCPGGDDPVLHKLSYITDPDSDRDLGLVRFLLDAQRTYQDCINKLIEWKNTSLVGGQLFVTPGLLRKTRITDEPGAVYEVPQPDQNIKWREPPKIPQELFQMLEQALGDIARITAQNDIPSQVESGKAIQALLERDATRRAEFLANLADWHSRVMRACLALVAKHYTEERTLQVRGRFGWAPVRAFKGAQLRDQVDVRVYPGSLEPRTKAEVERRVMTFAQLGWVQPEVAMSAINAGIAEKLVEDYDNDIGWANRRIEEIRQGPKAIFGKHGRPRLQPDEMADPNDPYFRAQLLEQTWRAQNDLPPLPPNEIPGWLPRAAHNIRVIKSAFESWMKTDDFELLPQPMQEVAEQIYDVLLAIEADKNARQMEAQAANAAALGMQNASAPQGEKQMPSFPNLPGQVAQNGQQ